MNEFFHAVVTDDSAMILWAIKKWSVFHAEL